MANTNAEINPRLISLLTGKEASSIPEVPAFSLLPGKYSKIVNQHKKLVQSIYKENKRFLICTNCGRKGKYDLGLLVFDYKRWIVDGKATKNDDPMHEAKTKNKRHVQDYLQTTGYFRCKHCNSGGHWETSNALLPFQSLTGLMNKKHEDKNFSLGELRLFDGNTYQWASDAEESFLDRLLETEQDGYVWNRLGDLYYKGGRPELAAAAYEHSIDIDPSQIESHFSLGELLMVLGEWKLAASHYQMMLLYARDYQNLDAFSLRKMLAVGLQHLLYIHRESKHEISFLPAQETGNMILDIDEVAASLEIPDFQNEWKVDADTLEPLFPLAELFMGAKTEGIPEHKRTLDKIKRMSHKAVGSSRKPFDQMWSRGSSDSKRNPVYVYVQSEEKAEKIALICNHYGIDYVIQFDYVENLMAFKKALVRKITPTNIYDPCTCGSDKKFKFCCASKLKNLNIEQFVHEFSTEV